MKCWKITLHACILLVICIIAGFISAQIIAKPVILTDEEINHYTNTAEAAWFEGFNSIKEHDGIEIKCDLNKQKVHIIPDNTNKQSVTVDFASTIPAITINAPVVSYWGCFFFYGIFFGLMAYVLLSIPIVLIKEKFFKKCKY